MKKISDSDLREILKVKKETRKGQYVATCPLCGKEDHFYISKYTQMWDCKKCGASGNIQKLLRYLDKTYLLGGSTIEDKETLQSIKQYLEESANEVELEDLPRVRMPLGWKVSKESNSYLKGRGITPADCVRYNIGETRLLDKYKNYALIPIYDDKVIRGFIGRYEAKHVPDDVLRYNNSIGTKFSQLLFGYDEITEHTTTVILVEGVFDKISTDKHLDLWSSDEIKCVCTFGKKISDEQIEKLKRKGILNVILLYDFDAIKDMKKYGLLLEQDFLTTITFTNGKKDIDECTKEEALEVFANCRSPRDFNIDVIGKIKRK